MAAVSEDGAWVITDEERTRHDLLFYSQNPKDGFLTGEQARALFIRSKLPLPELSRIWKLADVTRDNQLDAAEFGVAMHVIQARLRGRSIPSSLPETLKPTPTKVASIPSMTTVERDAYQKTFDWKDKDNTGFIDADTARSMFMSSCLSEDVLAKVWNLADIDRDGKLSPDEFAIALHLVRFSKKGYDLNGTVNVLSMIPKQAPTDSLEGRKQRLTEVLTEKRKLNSLKEKLAREIDGSKDDEVVLKKIQPEYEKVQFEILQLETQEEELRKVIHRMKESNKKDTFRPFDRSFLLKKRTTGQEIFSNSSGEKTSLQSEDGRILTQILDTDNLAEFKMNEQPSKVGISELSENGFKTSLKHEEINSFSNVEELNFTNSSKYSNNNEATSFQNGGYVDTPAEVKTNEYLEIRTYGEYQEDIDGEDMGAKQSSEKKRKSKNKNTNEAPSLTNFKPLNTEEENQDSSRNNNYEINGSYNYNDYQATSSYNHTTNNCENKLTEDFHSPNDGEVRPHKNGSLISGRGEESVNKNDITALFVLEAMKYKPEKIEKVVDEEVIIRHKRPMVEKASQKWQKEVPEEITPCEVVEIESNPDLCLEVSQSKEIEYRARSVDFVQETVEKTEMPSSVLAWHEAIARLDIDSAKSDVEIPKKRDEMALWVLQAMGQDPQRVEKVLDEEIVLKKDVRLPRVKERTVKSREEVPAPMCTLEIESSPEFPEPEFEKEPLVKFTSGNVVHEEVTREESKKEDEDWVNAFEKMDSVMLDSFGYKKTQPAATRVDVDKEIIVEKRSTVESNVDIDDMFRRLDEQEVNIPKDGDLVKRGQSGDDLRRNSKTQDTRRPSQTDVTFELLKYEIDIDEAGREGQSRKRDVSENLFTTDSRIQIPPPLLKDEEEKLREAREKARLEVLRVKEEEERIAEIRKINFESERKKLEEKLQKEKDAETQRRRLSAVEAEKKLTKEILHQKRKEEEISKPATTDEFSDFVFPAAGENQGVVHLRKTPSSHDGSKRKSFLELELEEQRNREEEAKRESEIRELEAKRIEEEKYRVQERLFQKQPSNEVMRERSWTLEEVESAPDVKSVLRKKREDERREEEERERKAREESELEELKRRQLEEESFWKSEERRRKLSEQRKADEVMRVKMEKEAKQREAEERKMKMIEERKRLAEEARKAREEEEAKKNDELKMLAELRRKSADEDERKRAFAAKQMQEEESRKAKEEEENRRIAAAQLREVEKQLKEKRQREEELRKRREADELKILQIREEEKKRAEEARAMMGISKQNFLEQKNIFQRKVQEEEEAAKKKVPITRRTGSFDGSRTPPSWSGSTTSSKDGVTSPQDKTTPEDFVNSFRNAFSRFEEKSQSRDDHAPVIMRNKSSSGETKNRQTWCVGDNKSAPIVEEMGQKQHSEEPVFVEKVQGVEESGPAPFWASQVKLKRSGSGLTRLSETIMKQDVNSQLQREEEMKRENERRAQISGVPPNYKRTESQESSSTASYTRQGSVDKDGLMLSTRGGSGASSSSSSRKSSVDGGSSRGDSVDGPARNRSKRSDSESSSRGEGDNSPLVSEFDFVRMRKKMFEQPAPVNSRPPHPPRGDKPHAGVTTGKHTVEIIERKQVQSSESAPPGTHVHQQVGIVKTQADDRKTMRVGSGVLERDARVEDSSSNRRSITSTMTAHWNTFYASLDEPETEELKREKRLEKVQMDIQREKEEERKKEEELKHQRDGFAGQRVGYSQHFVSTEEPKYEETRAAPRNEEHSGAHVQKRESIEEQRERELQEERRLLEKRFEQRTDEKPRRKGNLAAMWEQKVAKH